MENPHKGLGTLSTVFTIVAWLALVLAIVGAVGVLMGGAQNTPRIAGLAVLAIGGLYFCLFSALGGILKILLVIEEQTRKPPIS